VHQKVVGIGGLLMDMRVKGKDAAAENAITAMETEYHEQELRLAELVKNRDVPRNRRELITLQARAHGLVGEARQLSDLIEFLQPSETESCLDNELALVLMPEDYPRGRWMNNPMSLENYPKARHMTNVPRTLMVCRVDGSSMEKAKEMIDRSLAIEKKGLDGKMYLDARGIQTGPYAIMDQEMRELAAWMKKNGDMEVVLDDRPELVQAKDCPDAALYCGWYSLQNYQETCQWVAGAVGYHVASSEMLSLHRVGEQGWVVNLLNRGFCGTLGPTAEPYLTSFPNPAHFFPLLMCGEFTQGEVWQVTAPMLSWRTGYVGDPLYNPFKARPRVKIEAVKEHPVMRNAFLMLRPEIKLEAGTEPAGGGGGR
jgi:uncharacterized protein (TIGR03790 family)